MEPRALSLGVYVITSSGLVEDRGHREVALAAIEGGADAVQLRAPELADDVLLPLAEDLAAACRRAAVLFLVNDRLRVAVSSHADGVHLGQDDELEGARDRLGAGRVLGISVSNPGEARAAARAGADYVGVTVWSTSTKPEARPQGVGGLRRVVAATSLPVVGVGGIHAGNAAGVIGAGAAGVAVISAVGAAPDPVAATRDLVRVVRSHTREVRGR